MLALVSLIILCLSDAGNAMTVVKVRQSLDSPDAPWYMVYICVRSTLDF